MTDFAQAPTIVTRDAATAPRSHTLRLRSWPARYGLAIVLTGIALAVTLLLASIVQRSVFIFFWPTVIAAAWFGGLGPALLAALMSVAAVDYFIIPPKGF